MANLRDVASVIESALDEIGVAGALTVSMDEQEVKRSVGTHSADDLRISVHIEDLLKAA